MITPEKAFAFPQISVDTNEPAEVAAMGGRTMLAHGASDGQYNIVLRIGTFAMNPMTMATT